MKHTTSNTRAAAPQVRGITREHDFITIVSGLPRSGTSMMMKMLDCGTMDILSDNTRKADIDNPRGYYELEKVKQLSDDNSWLKEARGKVVKVVSPLLTRLNLDGSFHYKVIFMLRSLDEVLASQKKMAARMQHMPAAVQGNILKQNFSVHLEEIRKWMEEQPSIEFIYVNYADVVTWPEAVTGEVCTFLGLELDREKMLTVADAALYRHRSQDTESSSTLTEAESDRHVIMDQLKQLGYL